MTMREYAHERVRVLLDDAVFQMHDAARLRDPESVHKMRVAIRRFQQALRVFKQFLPGGGTRKVRRQLRKVMGIAGQLRNRDIAIELLGEGNAARAQLQRERLEIKRQLVSVLHDVSRPGVSIKWRSRLGLNT